MKVIILNGAAGSGKNTFKQALGDVWGLSVRDYSSIDWAKEVALEKFGWDGVKDVASRKLLSGIKQLGIQYGDIPFEKVKIEIQASIIGGADIIVVDIREPDEIEKLVKWCQDVRIFCRTIRIYNTKAEHKVESGDYDLQGDRLYGAYDYDYGVPNNGTMEEFISTIKNTMNHLFLK